MRQISNIQATDLHKKLTPHRFPFHQVIPEHDDKGGADFRQHVMQSEFFHEQPHAGLVDPQPHDAGTDEQRRLPAGLLPRACKHEDYTQPVVDDHRHGEGNRRGIQVMDSQPFRTDIKQGVVYYKGGPAHDGKAHYLKKLIPFHDGCYLLSSTKLFLRCNVFS